MNETENNGNGNVNSKSNSNVTVKITVHPKNERITKLFSGRIFQFKFFDLISFKILIET